MRSASRCDLVAELHCLHSQAVALRVLRHAPDLDTRAIARTPMGVLGGARDRVVPMPWVRYTALRYGVAPRFVDGGHRLMLGRAAGEVMRTLPA